jgi:hypothetical protein
MPMPGTCIVLGIAVVKPEIIFKLNSALAAAYCCAISGRDSAKLKQVSFAPAFACTQ